jgi:hypothetical protein
MQHQMEEFERHKLEFAAYADNEKENIMLQA